MKFIFRNSCSSFVRLIYHPLWGNMTTGQVSCYRTGQIMNSQQSRGLCLRGSIQSHRIAQLGRYG